MISQQASTFQDVSADVRARGQRDQPGVTQARVTLEKVDALDQQGRRGLDPRATSRGPPRRSTRIVARG
jgi:hypothetical protein